MLHACVLWFLVSLIDGIDSEMFNYGCMFYGRSKKINHCMTTPVYLLYL